MPETPALPPYPLEEKVARLFERLSSLGLTVPTGLDRGFYLDLAEVLLRDCAQWQDSRGAVRDPYTAQEYATTTSRFVGAGGLLIGAGRCLDLLDAVVRSMDLCCESLAICMHLGQRIAAAEFWTKELMYAYRGLAGHVPEEKRGRWAQQLAAFDPWQRYGSCRERARHNWPVYAICGEQLKQHEGLVDAEEFIDTVLENQVALLTAEGMYRDPGDPATYDLTCRQQMALMLHFGYRGRYREWLDEICRRGALTQLLFTSTTGQMPFGGRSNQFHIMEAMAACICEREARRYAEGGDVARAGALKRAARQAVWAVAPWIQTGGQWWSLKNRFDPALAHGFDEMDYHSAYGALTASLLGTAWLLADDSIAEALTPADAGGHVVELWPAFHRTFATCQGYHVEVDLKGQPRRDATGLGRLHRRGVRPETALSMPLPSFPEVHLSVPAAEREWAIGPVWLDDKGEERRLAECSEQIEEARVRIIREEPDQVSFQVVYRGDLFGATKVVEKYELSKDGLQFSASITGEVKPVGFAVPLLVTDGQGEARISVRPRGVEVHYEGQRYTVEVLGDAPVKVRLTDEQAPNSTAIYRIAIIETDLSKAVLRLKLE
jgi:hypothetical protein